jgi:magnesium transporter
MLKILLTSEMDTLNGRLTPYIISQIKNYEIDRFECHDNVNLISFDWYDVEEKTPIGSRIIICDTADDLFFICRDEQSLNMVKRIVNDEDENEKTLYNFFSELIKGDTESLEKFEEEITSTEDSLLTSANKNKADDIISFRRKVLILKKYYEQLNRIFEGLVENENELISKESMRYFRILDSRIDRLFSNVLSLRDYITQVREAYQAQIDIEQNNIMKIFTVVTAIFLPLTLLVGWYGMNLRMPEFSWKYGYLFVICLSIFILIACLLLFKKKKWF